jgi:hypothetical protein
MNDVRIISLNMATVLIEDIAMDVSHGVMVTIPADKAAKSKDLWRLISQKMLFRLNPGPFADYPPPPPGQPTPSSAEADRLREENRLLAEQNRMLRQVLDNQGGKLDMILGALESARFAGPSSPASATAKADNGVVDAGVPTYIPSEIKPKNVESHVEVQSETSEGSNITGAGEALRKLRRGIR